MDLVTYLVCARRSAAEPPSNDEPHEVVRSGIVRMKRDGLFAGWREKWMVLQGDTLTFYNTGTPRRIKTGVIQLKDVDRIERVDAKPYCLELEANGRRYLVALKSDGELYEWQDEVYVRSGSGGFSQPFGFAHVGHVGWDAPSGGFTVVGATAQAAARLLS
ncbi:hypothetical protein F5887DRAFT_1077462 [Amanita rubescens]|nr:hypothetical protein F5887DRAFT_1174493 [Amanita rubescens]KAF8339224.1 hypothetical protein F5887DRAFT_1077462 [Amanita rubescens]